MTIDGSKRKGVASRSVVTKIADGGGNSVSFPEPPTEDGRLLSAAIKASGMSVRKFAELDLVRAPRTVWRYLAGEIDVPAAVRERCERILAGKASVQPGEE